MLTGMFKFWGLIQKGLFPIIFKYWKLTLLLIMSLAFGMVYNDRANIILQAEVNNKECEFKQQEARNNITELNAINGTLSDSISKQNNLIQQLSINNKALVDKRRKADEARLLSKQQYDAKVLEILQRKTPTTCEDSIDFLSNGIKKLQW